MATGKYLLLIGERWVHKLPVEDAGALGVRGEQPDHKCDFQFEIKGKPERDGEARIKIRSETDRNR